MSYKQYNNKNNDLWQFKEAKRITSFERFILLVLVITGVFFILRLADWWFRNDHIGNPTFYIILSHELYEIMQRTIVSPGLYLSGSITWA